MDLHAVFGGGDTLEAAKRNMAEAVAFHLEDLPEDQFIAPAEPARQAVAICGWAVAELTTAPGCALLGLSTGAVP